MFATIVSFDDDTTSALDARALVVDMSAATGKRGGDAMVDQLLKGCAATTSGFSIVCGLMLKRDTVANAAAWLLGKVGLLAQGEYDFLTVPDTIAAGMAQAFDDAVSEIHRAYVAERLARGMSSGPSIEVARAEFLRECVKRWPGTPYRLTKKGRRTELVGSLGPWGFASSGWPQPPSSDDVRLYASEFAELFYHARALPMAEAAKALVAQLGARLDQATNAPEITTMAIGSVSRASVSSRPTVTPVRPRRFTRAAFTWLLARAPGAQRLSSSILALAASPQGATQDAAALVGSQYQVEDGDWPDKIARKLLGSGYTGAATKQLLNANPQKPKGSDGNFKTLYGGELLNIPQSWWPLIAANGLPVPPGVGGTGGGGGGYTTPAIPGVTPGTGGGGYTIPGTNITVPVPGVVPGIGGTGGGTGTTTPGSLPPGTILQAQIMLAAWSGQYPHEQSVTNFGLEASDYSGVVDAKTSFALSSFQKWSNATRGTKVNTAGQLDQPSYDALTAWSASAMKTPGTGTGTGVPGFPGAIPGLPGGYTTPAIPGVVPGGGGGVAVPGVVPGTPAKSDSGGGGIGMAAIIGLLLFG